MPAAYALVGARKPYVPLADGSFVFNLAVDSMPPQRMRIGLSWAGK